MKKIDEYTIHLIVLVIFLGALILLEHIFSESLESFIAALLPTILLILFYILLNRRTATFEGTVKDILETHIPDTVYIDGADAIKMEFTEAVKNADKYIMTTGGRAKIKDYLSAIEENIEKKDIEYYRILFGKKISNELREHLLKIIGKHGVYVSHTDRELSPTLLITEKMAFIGLPEPEHHEFKTCLKIPEKKIIEKMGRYIRVWYAKTNRLSSEEDLKKIETD
ncbi:MAG TPA: hypothetical protein ENH13_00935 [Euryarchaeota archaeon]|nr:hypothetical protein [Euryarchaeota archaeon]